MILNGKITGFIGISSVILLALALLVFGVLNSEFSFTNDFISKLGAKGEPNAFWWNLIGFITVGSLLFTFGILYGINVKDKLVSIFLSLFGLGFALISIPMDMSLPNTVHSKTHIVVVCFGLAFWMFALSRMSHLSRLGRKIRKRANIAVVLLVLSIFGHVLELWPMPVTHRLVFGIIFGWTFVTSLELTRQTTIPS